MSDPDDPFKDYIVGIWIGHYDSRESVNYSVILRCAVPSDALGASAGTPVSSVIRSFSPAKVARSQAVAIEPPHSILNGVIGWGFAMIIAEMTSTCVEWMIYRSPSDQPTLWRFAKTTLIWTIAGVFFGLINSYPKTKQNDE
jgi:hypothetical protein